MARVIGENELHVWRASLDLALTALQKLESKLNTEEKARAERFLVPLARQRFIAARGILRELLARYLGLEPGEIALSYGPQGKPSLAPGHQSRICFNVSHSGNKGMLVFANDAEVGVDVEQVRQDFKGMEIASRFFSEQEIAELTELPEGMASERFFDCWTKKEAYVKAHGQGLSVPLRSFTVRLGKEHQTIEDEAGKRWGCYRVEAGTGFAGAVVAAGENWKLKSWEWSAEEQKATAVPVDGTL